MEGRTIARPNGWAARAYHRAASALQWRAGQLPGQTGGRRGRTTGRHRPFNGGPDNCPAKRQPSRACAAADRRPSMEGRTIARPNSKRQRALSAPAAFNGGPDNCPAKRVRVDPAGRSVRRPSMEGRTIARPNRTRRRPTACGGLSFNGGPDNCPAKHQLRWGPALHRQPSMEGRTIARPNPWGRVVVARDNASLQWRAGQLPGQTWRSCVVTVSDTAAFNGGPDNCPAKPTAITNRPAYVAAPSMEGRTIARPNTARGQQASREITVLQWRAGQLPGQTCRRWSPARPMGPSFNGGPDNCPAKRDPMTVHSADLSPSMEGRTIARPNIRSTPSFVPWLCSLQWRAGQLPGQTWGAAVTLVGCFTLLQWRAGQLPGQTCRARTAAKRWRSLQWRAGQLPGQTLRHRAPGGPDWPPFNGGPDNCPAKLRPRNTLVAATGALQWRAGQLPGQTTASSNGCNASQMPSMEGRTIARPNRRPPSPIRPSPRPFNGGPDNCPAKRRAGLVRPDTTPPFNGGPDNCPAKLAAAAGVVGCDQVPSMEGRTIARPNSHPAATDRLAALPSMEGRTIARPNTRHRSAHPTTPAPLQWRAGQLPGQTWWAVPTGRPPP